MEQNKPKAQTGNGMRAEITGTTRQIGKDEKQLTFYLVLVHHGSRSWVVHRRYSEFREKLALPLYDVHKLNLDSFPSRTIFSLNPDDPSFIKERQEALNRWLVALTRRDLSKNKIVMSFLDPTNESMTWVQPPPAIQNTPSFGSNGIPTVQAIDEMFADLQARVGFPESTLTALPPKAKWRLLQQYPLVESNTNKGKQPEEVVAYLEQHGVDCALNFLNELVVLLQGYPTRWMEQFRSLKGDMQLLSILNTVIKSEERESLLPQTYAILKCLKAIINSSAVDFSHILSVPLFLHTLVQTLKVIPPSDRYVPLEIISFALLHFESIDQFSVLLEEIEALSYQFLVDCLSGQNHSVRKMVLVFVNALLYHAGTGALQETIMNELIDSGFYDSFLQLHTLFADDAQWLVQVDTFKAFPGWPDRTQRLAFLMFGKPSVNTLEEANALIRKLRKELRLKDTEIAELRKNQNVISNVVPLAPIMARAPGPPADMPPPLPPSQPEELVPDAPGPPVDMPPPPPPSEPEELIPDAPSRAPPPVASISPRGNSISPRKKITSRPASPSRDAPKLPETKDPKPPMATVEQKETLSSPRSGNGLPSPPPARGGPPPPSGARGIPLGKKPPEGLAMKENLKPEIKMRPLNWKALPNSKIKGTIWINVNHELPISRNSVHELFGIIATEPSTLKGSIIPTTTTFIDPKRTNNIEIMLKAFKVTNEEIREALLRFDSNILPIEHVVAIRKNLPNPDETHNIFRYEGDIPLAKADRYIKEILQVPNLELHMLAFEFKLSFEIRCDTLLDGIQILLKASQLIRESKEFLSVLSNILSIGNYVNGGTPRGGVYGFSMETLQIIGDMKSTLSPQSSMLHYLASHIDTDEFKSFLDSFKSSTLQLASTEETSEITTDVRLLHKEYLNLSHHLSFPGCSLEYKNGMEIWLLDSVGPQVSHLLAESERMNSDFASILALFAEPPTTKSTDFYLRFYKFASDLELAAVQNKKAQLEESKKIEREGQLAQVQLEIPKLGSEPEAPKSGEFLPWTQFDDMLSSLKNGDFDEVNAAVGQRRSLSLPKP